MTWERTPPVADFGSLRSDRAIGRTAGGDIAALRPGEAFP
jgi:hypothetical protein